jgi:hypothetical protein
VLPKVTLPEKVEGRQRWLTRNEAARLLGAVLGYVWDAQRKGWKRTPDGLLLRRERWIINRRRPAARFILVGLYSARREETIRRTQWVPTTTHPWMNLDAMVYQGRGAEERRTKKRRPPATIANRLRPHLVRWRNIDSRRAAGCRPARDWRGDPLRRQPHARWPAARRQDPHGMGGHSGTRRAW